MVLHGWLNAAEVPEFEKQAAAHGPLPCIDLAHLAGADRQGMRALKRQRTRGAHLVGASPYIELLLERTKTDEHGSGE